MELLETACHKKTEKDEEGMVHQVKLYSENGETIGIFSCYPKEAEEGFGVRIRTIIDTFEWDIK